MIYSVNVCKNEGGVAPCWCLASARLTANVYCGNNYWNSWKQNKLLQFHARLGHSLIPTENQINEIEMVVVSNFEKIEDQDQEYDESDCVDLFCCAMVSLSLDNKGIREKNIR